MSLGVGIGSVVVSHFLTALFGASVLGLIWGATNGRVPGAVLGFGAALLFGVSLAIGARLKGSPTFKELLLAAPIMGIILGAPVGYLAQRELHKESSLDEEGE